MSGINSAINNSLSALDAFETGISVVSNNIANTNTAGYSAESTDIQTSYLSSNQVGTGVVNPVQIVRAASGLAAAQLRTANTANAAASAQSTSLGAISSALENNGDIQQSMSQFFSDISALSANPSSAALRQTVLSDAQAVTTTFQSASSNIDAVIAGAQTNVSTGITAANNSLSNLYNINQSLQRDPNNPSLLDQQQAALNTLSQYLPVNAVTQSNGSVLVASGGTMLLDQSGVQTLAASFGSANSNPVITAGNGNALLTLSDSDGSLGSAVGTITAGNQALQSLGNVATGFATQVNQSQAEGLDATGNQGGNLFTIQAPIATAASGNTGNAQVTVGNVTGSVALPITLTYNNGSWSTANPTTGYPQNLGPTLSTYGGLALSVSGVPGNGDRFTINAAPNAAAGLSVAATSTNAIAAADPYVATPGELQLNGSIVDSNAGTITAGTDDVVNSLPSGAQAVPANYFKQNLQINFGSSGSYTISLAGQTTPAIASGTLTAGSDGSYNGNIYVQYPSSSGAAPTYWQLPISGTPAAGDTVTLQPGGTSSGSNAQRLAALWTAPSTTSSGSLEQSVVGLATGLGSNASAAQDLATSTSSQVTIATSNLSTVAGVNTDQQAVLLTNFQQAYQAAAQVITTAHSMFESLISAV